MNDGSPGLTGHGQMSLPHGHSHSPVSVVSSPAITCASASGVPIGQMTSANAYYSLPPGKYQENGDTLSDFVNLVCQEAQNTGAGQQVFVYSLAFICKPTLNNHNLVIYLSPK